jgi:hypothetical protein
MASPIALIGLLLSAVAVAQTGPIALAGIERMAGSN